MSNHAIKEGLGDIWLENYKEATKNLNIDAYNQSFDNEKSNFRIDPFGDPYTDKTFYGVTREEQLEMKKKQTTVKAPVDPQKALASSMRPRNRMAPSVLFNSMTKSIAPYTLKGILWYQGESDVKYPQTYRMLFVSLIKEWRQLWKEDLPFLYVQLPPFEEWFESSGKNYPLIREDQQWVSEHVPNVAMIVIEDVGEQWDIHPKNKKTVGERLAVAARSFVYHEDIDYEAPYLVDGFWQQNEICLVFKYADTGLILKGNQINGLVIKQNKTIILDYTFTLEKNQIKISSPSLTKEKEIEVSIGWMPYCQINLYNTYQMPARQAKISIQKATL